MLLEVKPDPALAAAQGRKKKLVHLTNFHILSGSRNLGHQIPGKKVHQRLHFKQELARRALNASLVEAEKYAADADQRRSNHPIFLLAHDI